MEAINNKGFFARMINFFKVEPSVTNIELVVPNDVYYRTELICECISDELDLDFGLAHFLTALYDNFIYEAITKYDTKKIIKSLRSRRIYERKAVVVIDGEEELCTLFADNISTILIEMQNSDIKKGELILSELEALYSCNVSFPELMSNVWIDYIEQYKQGNKTAYSHLLKIIRE